MSAERKHFCLECITYRQQFPGKLKKISCFKLVHPSASFNTELISRQQKKARQKWNFMQSSSSRGKNLTTPLFGVKISTPNRSGSISSPVYDSCTCKQSGFQPFFRLSRLAIGGSQHECPSSHPPPCQHNVVFGRRPHPLMQRWGEWHHRG